MWKCAAVMRHGPYLLSRQVRSAKVVLLVPALHPLLLFCRPYKIPALAETEIMLTLRDTVLGLPAVARPCKNSSVMRFV